MSKICLKCKKLKDDIEFRENRNSCKYCEKHYYQINKEHYKKYRDNNKKKTQKYCKKYYINNKNNLINYQKKYNIEHKIEIQDYQKNYRQEYNKTHKKERRFYFTNRCKNDIEFKLIRNLRKRIWDAIKLNYKSARTIELLGCSIEFLKNHLEKKFTKGMNWQNYGKWHIDHIKPCASFDLSKPEEQRKCFHYGNLQPLWAKDNLSKGDRIYWRLK